MTRLNINQRKVRQPIRDLYNKVIVEKNSAGIDCLVLRDYPNRFEFPLKENNTIVLVVTAEELWKRPDNSNTLEFIGNIFKEFKGQTLESKLSELTTASSNRSIAIFLDQWKINFEFNYSASLQKLHESFDQALIDFNFGKISVISHQHPEPKNQASEVETISPDTLNETVSEIKAKEAPQSFEILTNVLEQTPNYSYKISDSLLNALVANTGEKNKELWTEVTKTIIPNIIKKISEHFVKNHKREIPFDIKDFIENFLKMEIGDMVMVSAPESLDEINDKIKSIFEEKLFKDPVIIELMHKNTLPLNWLKDFEKETPLLPLTISPEELKGSESNIEEVREDSESSRPDSLMSVKSVGDAGDYIEKQRKMLK